MIHYGLFTSRILCGTIVLALLKSADSKTNYWINIFLEAIVVSSRVRRAEKQFTLQFTTIRFCNYSLVTLCICPPASADGTRLQWIYRFLVPSGCQPSFSVRLWKIIFRVLFEIFQCNYSIMFSIIRPSVWRRFKFISTEKSCHNAFQVNATFDQYFFPLKKRHLTSLRRSFENEKIIATRKTNKRNDMNFLHS